MNSVVSLVQRVVLAAIRSVIKRIQSKIIASQVVREEADEEETAEGDQIEGITPGESQGLRTGERGERGRCRGRRGGLRVRLSRERDCTMVGPLYRDPRPAAQLLISSTAHQSLVHDPPSRKVSLSRSLPPPYRSRNLAVPLEGYLETADGPRSERGEGKGGGGRTRLFML